MITGFLYLIISYTTNGQTASYQQLSGEIQFNRSFRESWSTELDLAGVFSDTPTETKAFKTFIQKSARCWIHNQTTPRWKLSAFVAYYDNKDVPEIGQYYSPEWRFALQGTYYFHKIGYTLSTRLRPEFRFITNEQGDYDDQLRYRQQLKFVKPLNSKVFRKNVIYVIASDELFFRSNVKNKGINFVDRNRFSVGGGYLVTDDLQVEIVYMNEYLPRDTENQVYNSLGLTVTFNNLLSNIHDKINQHKIQDSDPE
ncbi:MAG TPA: DUF2490 domain-containing protein [Bacteroidia bacterium]|nr:DUF2490 domain-containing protein [Bacteroidia bacterium]